MGYNDYFRGKDWEVYDRADREEMKIFHERIGELLAEGKQYVTKIFTTGCGETFQALRVVG